MSFNSLNQQVEVQIQQEDRSITPPFMLRVHCREKIIFSTIFRIFLHVEYRDPYLIT